MTLNFNQQALGLKIALKRGPWLAHSVEHLILNLGAMSLSPKFNVEIT